MAEETIKTSYISPWYGTVTEEQKSYIKMTIEEVAKHISIGNGDLKLYDLNNILAIIGTETKFNPMNTAVTNSSAGGLMQIVDFSAIVHFNRMANGDVSSMYNGFRFTHDDLQFVKDGSNATLFTIKKGSYERIYYDTVDKVQVCYKVTVTVDETKTFSILDLKLLSDYYNDNNTSKIEAMLKGISFKRIQSITNNEDFTNAKEATDNFTWMGKASTIIHSWGDTRTDFDYSDPNNQKYNIELGIAEYLLKKRASKGEEVDGIWKKYHSAPSADALAGFYPNAINLDFFWNIYIEDWNKNNNNSLTANEYHKLISLLSSEISYGANISTKFPASNTTGKPFPEADKRIDRFLIGNNGEPGKLTGGDGADIILGGTGKDELFGRDGDDYLYGGDGDDFLHGMGGGDHLYGGGGTNYLYGGQGDDTYYIGEGKDIIMDSDGKGQIVIKGLNDDNPIKFDELNAVCFNKKDGENNFSFNDEKYEDLTYFW